MSKLIQTNEIKYLARDILYICYMYEYQTNYYYIYTYTERITKYLASLKLVLLIKRMKKKKKKTH